MTRWSCSSADWLIVASLPAWSSRSEGSPTNCDSGADAFGGTVGRARCRSWLPSSLTGRLTGSPIAPVGSRRGQVVLPDDIQATNINDLSVQVVSGPCNHPSWWWSERTSCENRCSAGCRSPASSTFTPDVRQCIEVLTGARGLLFGVGRETLYRLGISLKLELTPECLLLTCRYRLRGLCRSWRATTGRLACCGWTSRHGSVSWTAHRQHLLRRALCCTRQVSGHG